MVAAEIVRGSTYHRRFGAVRHDFRHGIDLVMIDPETSSDGWMFGRNRSGLASVHDSDHGGPRGAGQGSRWARDVLGRAGLPDGYRLSLLTQPRWFGTVFNPVSFWLAFRDGELVAAIAEVNNTYGDRHNYLCVKRDFSPIAPGEVIRATKVFHVSPFQDVSGSYAFTFDIRPGSIAIRIAHRNGREGLVAVLEGSRRRLSAARVLRAAARFPFAGVRAIGLIHWQALRLKLKGARFNPRPTPPDEEVTPCHCL